MLGVSTWFLMGRKDRSVVARGLWVQGETKEAQAPLQISDLEDADAVMAMPAWKQIRRLHKTGDKPASHMSTSYRNSGQLA